MIVLGLTGSIAMGKTETAKLFRARGIPVFDSDAAVHELYASGGGAVEAVRKLAPLAVENGAVNREMLSSLIRSDATLLAKLEAVVHPLVKAKQREFFAAAKRSGALLVVIDIPLLFETGRDADVDVVAVVSAPPDVQRRRALARPGMTAEKLDLILSRQMADAEKRARADYVIDTSVSITDTAKEVDRLILELKTRHSGARR